MGWFLYDNGLHHERVKGAFLKETINSTLLKEQSCKIYAKDLRMRILSKEKSFSFIKGEIEFFIILTFISVCF